MKHWDRTTLASRLLKPMAAQVTSSRLQPAAVLVLLVDSLNGLEVVLTRRAKHLKHHPGQISFPGGKAEPSDKDLIHTALREAHEEIGLPIDSIQILGSFPGSETISQFQVTPIVAYSDFQHDWVIDHNEVQQVIQVPLDWLLHESNWRVETGIFRKNKHHYYACWWQQHLIWGATGQLIKNLRQLVNVTDSF